jgi:hypothetical protein
MRPLALLMLPVLLLPALPAGAQPRPPTTFAEGISQDPATLLRLAEARLRAGQVAGVSELVERAESLLLTRAELASRAGSPARSEILTATMAARVALRAQDRAAATVQVDRARTLLSQQGAASVAGDKLDGPVAPEVPITQAAPVAVPQPWSPASPRSSSPLPIAKPAS